MGMTWRERILFLGFALSILFLGYAVDRTVLSQVLLGYGVAFAIYFHGQEKKVTYGLKDLLVLAFALRVILLFALPQLSDDYFRFIWDGLLQSIGENPFSNLPSAIQREDWANIYEGMNSKDYYSVYPPVMQGVFKIAELICNTSFLGNVVVMRMFLIAADMLLIFFGWKFLEFLGRKGEDIMLYALNPLVIIEGVGNLHFEVLMMSMTLIGIYFIAKSGGKNGWKKLAAAIVLLALGIATKLTSTIGIPALLRRLGFWKTLGLGLMVMILVMLSFSSFLTNDLIMNIGDSLNLYFRNFQFNSSVYNLVDYFVKPYVYHYRAELIGPWIALVGLLSMAMVMLFRKQNDWEGYLETLLFVFSIHLLFASTVHPWYVINLLVLSVFTRYRYPILFSFTVVFSYHFYDLGFESPFFLYVEYLPVIGYALWEISKGVNENEIAAAVLRAE